MCRQSPSYHSDKRLALQHLIDKGMLWTNTPPPSIAVSPVVVTASSSNNSASRTSSSSVSLQSLEEDCTAIDCGKALLHEHSKLPTSSPSTAAPRGLYRPCTSTANNTTTATATARTCRDSGASCHTDLSLTHKRKRVNDDQCAEESGEDTEEAEMDFTSSSSINPKPFTPLPPRAPRLQQQHEWHRGTPKPPPVSHSQLPAHRLIQSALHNSTHQSSPSPQLQAPPVKHQQSLTALTSSSPPAGRRQVVPNNKLAPQQAALSQPKLNSSTLHIGIGIVLDCGHQVERVSSRVAKQQVTSTIHKVKQLVPTNASNPFYTNYTTGENMHVKQSSFVLKNVSMEGGFPCGKLSKQTISDIKTLQEKDKMLRF
eukprot:gene27030-33690_t